MTSMTPVHPDIRQHIIDTCKSYTTDPNHRNSNMHKYNFYVVEQTDATKAQAKKLALKLFNEEISDNEFYICVARDGSVFDPLTAPTMVEYYYAKRKPRKIKAVIKKK